MIEPKKKAFLLAVSIVGILVCATLCGVLSSSSASDNHSSQNLRSGSKSVRDFSDPLVALPPVASSKTKAIFTPVTIGGAAALLGALLVALIVVVITKSVRQVPQENIDFPSLDVNVEESPRPLRVYAFLWPASILPALVILAVVVALIRSSQLASTTKVDSKSPHDVPDGIPGQQPSDNLSAVSKLEFVAPEIRAITLHDTFASIMTRVSDFEKDLGDWESLFFYKGHRPFPHFDSQLVKLNPRHQYTLAQLNIAFLIQNFKAQPFGVFLCELIEDAGARTMEYVAGHLTEDQWSSVTYVPLSAKVKTVVKAAVERLAAAILEELDRVAAPGSKPLVQA